MVDNTYNFRFICNRRKRQSKDQTVYAASHRQGNNQRHNTKCLLLEVGNMHGSAGLSGSGIFLIDTVHSRMALPPSDRTYSVSASSVRVFNQQIMNMQSVNKRSQSHSMALA
ncbi:MAG TPA: hypothetical protein VHF65_03405 [Nitrososphaera sp.]|nr:hypothetical protein [Nitrososphaera sp.]